MSSQECCSADEGDFPDLIASFQNLSYAQKRQDLGSVVDIIESLIQKDFGLCAQGITNAQKQNRVREIGGISTLVHFLSLPSSYFMKIDLFEEENEIKKNVIVLLHCLCVKNPVNKISICDTGVLPILIEFYKQKSESDMIEVVVALLDELLTKNLPMQRVFHSLQGIPLLLHNARCHWQYNQFIAEKELHLLDELISTSSEFHTELCNAGVVTLFTDYLFKTTSLSFYNNKNNNNTKNNNTSFSPVTEQEDMFLRFTTLSSSFDNIDDYETLAQAKARGVHEVEKCPQDDMRLYSLHALHHLFSTSPGILWTYFIPNNGLKPLLALLYNLEIHHDFADNVFRMAEYSLRILLLIFHCDGYETMNDKSTNNIDSNHYESMKEYVVKMAMEQFINESDESSYDIGINSDLDVIQLQGIPAILHVLYLCSESLFLQSQSVEQNVSVCYIEDTLLLSCIRLALKVLAKVLFWEKVLEKNDNSSVVDNKVIDSNDTNVDTVVDPPNNLISIETESILMDSSVQEAIFKKYSSRLGKLLTRHCGLPCLISMLLWQAYHLEISWLDKVQQNSNDNSHNTFSTSNNKDIKTQTIDVDNDKDMRDLSWNIMQLLLFVMLFLPGKLTNKDETHADSNDSAFTSTHNGKQLLYENVDVIYAMLSLLPDTIHATALEQFSIFNMDTSDNVSGIDDFVKDNMKWFQGYFPGANQLKDMVYLHLMMAKILYPEIVSHILQQDDIREHVTLPTVMSV